MTTIDDAIATAKADADTALGPIFQDVATAAADAQKATDQTQIDSAVQAAGDAQKAAKTAGDQLAAVQGDLAAAKGQVAQLTGQVSQLQAQAASSRTPLPRFGFRCGPNTPGGPAGATEQKRLTDAMGGPLGVERIFNMGGTRWKVPSSTARSIILSIDLDPAGLAAGNYTAQLKTLLAGCKGFETVWLIPMPQEPDLGNKGVTPAQSAAMISYVKKNIAPAFPNVRVGTTVTSFEAANGVDVAAYSGPDADFAGMDCYENPTVPKLSTLVKVYTLGVQLAQKLGLPLIIPETAIRPGSTVTADTHAQHVSDGIAYLMTAPVDVQAVAWFDSNKAGAANEADWRIENYPASTALWKAAVRVSCAA